MDYSKRIDLLGSMCVICREISDITYSNHESKHCGYHLAKDVFRNAWEIHELARELRNYYQHKKYGIL